jgi:hypothetical protein
MRLAPGRPAAAVLLLLAAASCSSAPALCCLEFKPGTPEAKYCNDHRDAVAVYFYEPEEDRNRLERYEAFGAFFKTLENARSVEEIEQAVRAASTIPGFLARYERKHRQAEEAGITDPGLRTRLILCGFRHALEAFRQERGKR